MFHGKSGIVKDRVVTVVTNDNLERFVSFCACCGKVFYVKLEFPDNFFCCWREGVSPEHQGKRLAKKALGGILDGTRLVNDLPRAGFSGFTFGPFLVGRGRAREKGVG